MDMLKVKTYIRKYKNNKKIAIPRCETEIKK